MDSKYFLRENNMLIQKRLTSISNGGHESKTCYLKDSAQSASKNIKQKT